MATKERRQENRIGISFPVECTLLPDRKKVFYTVSRDLSMGGVRILTEDFVSPGQDIKLSINLINALAEVKAQVAWCNKRSYSEQYYVGLKFDEINEKNKSNLGKFIDKVNYFVDLYGKK
ncbi:MAG: PilZ domain-containing protein [Candidatus Omnitrophica bacterium]|nr:PilZ domain-containing protein [Candidatus Omnitrophota bacterium]